MRKRLLGIWIEEECSGKHETCGHTSCSDSHIKRICLQRCLEFSPVSHTEELQSQSAAIGQSLPVCEPANGRDTHLLNKPSLLESFGSLIGRHGVNLGFYVDQLKQAIRALRD